MATKELLCKLDADALRLLAIKRNEVDEVRAVSKDGIFFCQQSCRVGGLH
jgi:hypothetical protein